MNGLRVSLRVFFHLSLLSSHTSLLSSLRRLSLLSSHTSLLSSLRRLSLLSSHTSLLSSLRRLSLSLLLSSSLSPSPRRHHQPSLSFAAVGNCLK
ncbi:hypothetical protein BVRB_9g209010 [Beta vulgaris subsp. vulgaris]|uniref:Uncharacterized protein n=1 Tax=Beta vulgaris subsp. vulgaris TaxID=3555 RepID=A0A0J8BPP1_BETVV|nr:hypothetical protein BVRB_9g209010 [Beta vulgaris subsp. vulgaris]